MISQNESGRNLMEILAVLGIMAVITISAMIGIGAGLYIFRAEAIRRDVEEIPRGLLDVYSWSGGYASLTMETVCNNEVLSGPCQLGVCPDGPGWVMLFGERICVAPAGNDSFRITVSGLNETSCRNLAAMRFENVVVIDGSCVSNQVVFGPK